jgi:hypothetical protein
MWHRHPGCLLEFPAPDLQLLVSEDSETDGGGESIADGIRKILEAVGSHVPSVDGVADLRPCRQ